jgi:hypothetical protein
MLHVSQITYVQKHATTSINEALIMYLTLKGKNIKLGHKETDYEDLGPI